MWIRLSPLVDVVCLCQHKYVSIAEIQIKNEEELEKCPMSLVSQGLWHTGGGNKRTVCSAVAGHTLGMH